jgi:uncharacterized protein YeaO (DUF488 family)
MTKPKLTAKQTAFAQYAADGLTASEAYRRAYGGNPNFTTTKREAYEVRHHPLVAAYIKELQEEAKAMDGLTRAEKRRQLALIVRDRDADLGRRLEAIKLDNLMTGENAAVKVEGEITLGTILKEIAPSTGLPSEDKRR